MANEKPMTTDEYLSKILATSHSSSTIFDALCDWEMGNWEEALYYINGDPLDDDDDDDDDE